MENVITEVNRLLNLVDKLIGLSDGYRYNLLNVAMDIRKTLENKNPMWAIKRSYGFSGEQIHYLGSVTNPLILTALTDIVVGKYKQIIIYNKSTKDLLLGQIHRYLLFDNIMFESMSYETYFILPSNLERKNFKKRPELRLTCEEREWLKEQRWKERRAALLVAHVWKDGRDFHTLKIIATFC